MLANTQRFAKSQILMWSEASWVVWDTSLFASVALQTCQETKRSRKKRFTHVGIENAFVRDSDDFIVQYRQQERPSATLVRQTGMEEDDWMPFKLRQCSSLQTGILRVYPSTQKSWSSSRVFFWWWPQLLGDIFTLFEVVTLAHNRVFSVMNLGQCGILVLNEVTGVAFVTWTP